jgi:deoxyribonuclease V
MKVNNLHAWDLATQAAITLQKDLAKQVIHNTPLDLNTVQTVAGVDVSVKNNISRAAVVVLRYPDLTILETAIASQPTPFPYVPGLLSFREGPVLVDAFEKLQHTPDVFIFDGMGRIHPRKFGIASHMGLWLDKPAIGCGKTYLIGDYDEPDSDKGAYSALTYHGEQLGVVLRTRKNVKPVFISPGHRMDIASAMALTMRVTTKYRLPEPIRAAHNAAGDDS